MAAYPRISKRICSSRRSQFLSFALVLPHGLAALTLQPESGSLLSLELGKAIGKPFFKSDGSIELREVIHERIPVIWLIWEIQRCTKPRPR